MADLGTGAFRARSRLRHLSLITKLFIMNTKKLISLILLLAVLCRVAQAQLVVVEDAKFCKGDDPAFSAFSFDDSGWQTLSLSTDWNQQGVYHSDAYAWYRLHAVIPSSLKKGVTPQFVLDLGPIDDNDETWLNGRLVGRTEGWQKERRYLVDPSLVRWDKENVIAVRVYNGADPGGFYDGPVNIGKPVLSDFVSMKLVSGCAVLHSEIKTTGTFRWEIRDAATDAFISSHSQPVELSPKKDATLPIPTDLHKRVVVTYYDKQFDESLGSGSCAPYILTPPAPVTPLSYLCKSQF